MLNIMVQSIAPATTLKHLLAAPYFAIKVILDDDTSLLGFLVLALAVLFTMKRKEVCQIAPLFFLSAAVETIAIYGWRGSGYNHLLGLQVASVMLIGASLAKASGPAQRDKVLLLAGLAAVGKTG